jgi:hypothetical protein
MVRIIVPVQQSHCMKAQLSLTTFFGFLDSHGANAYDNVESTGRKLRTSGAVVECTWHAALNGVQPASPACCRLLPSP